MNTQELKNTNTPHKRNDDFLLPNHSNGRPENKPYSLGAKLLMGGLFLGFTMLIGFLLHGNAASHSAPIQSLSNRAIRAIPSSNANRGQPICKWNDYFLLKPSSVEIKNAISIGKPQNKIIDHYQLAPSLNDVSMSIFRVFQMYLFAGGAARIVDRDQLLPYAPALPLVWGITREIYPHIQQYRLRSLCAQQNMNKNVVLILQAVSDLNGIFSYISNDYLKKMEQFSDTHTIVFQKVDTLEEINESINRVTKEGKKITHLFLEGHGQADRLALGSDDLVTEEKHETKGSWYSANQVSVSRIDFSKIERNAHIILHSCSTGASLPYPQMSIAEWVQYYAGETRKVHAPDQPSSGIGIELDNVFKIRFNDANLANISYEVASKKFKAQKKLSYEK